MTIEEYLKSEMDYGGKMRDGTRPDFDLEEFIYYEGYIDAMSAVLEHFPKLDHDVTLKEVKEFCAKRKEEADVDEDPCDYCPMAEKYSCSDGISFMQCGEIADILPCDWDIAKIEKRMKEAQQ